MNWPAPLAPFAAACRAAGCDPGAADRAALAPAVSARFAPADWGTAARLARENGLRWCGLWAQEEVGGCEVCAVLESGGCYLVLRTAVPDGTAVPSHAPYYAAADRPERHAHDLLGVAFADAPDTRRWTRHQAWQEDEFPLRASFPLAPARPPTGTDEHYPFHAAHGPGVVEIPVGPVHAGIIEPGHFRFQAVGEAVLNLEERLGYVHKGLEKLAVGRDAAGLARLAGRVSGDSTVAHAWAACQAMERALGVAVPRRALWLRALLAERERVANHLGDIGAICNDVGFTFAHVQLGRLREAWLRENGTAFGHRLLMDRVVPGGVAADLDPPHASRMAEHARRLLHEVAELVVTLEGSESLEERLMTTGRLLPESAAQLGVVGFVGRASGQPFDVRRDAPYAPYDELEVRVPGYRAGDVAARAKVRADEIGVSLGLIGRLLAGLPAGPYCAAWPAGHAAGEGLGMVDGWRGETVTYVRFDAAGHVARFFPRDPSWLTWPALELLIQGNIVPDFPVCNKSVNGSYAGQDL